MLPPIRILALIAIAAVLAAAEYSVEPGEALLRAPEGDRVAAATVRWKATPITFGDGPVRLDDAVAVLARSGNPTTLAPGVDGTRQAHLDLDDGDYWSAVLALCGAFALDLSPGEESSANEQSMHRQWAGPEDAQPLPLSTGGVMLIARDPARPLPLRQANGPLLIEIPELTLTHRESGDQRWIDLTLRVRAEPRLPSAMVGTCRARWQAQIQGRTLRPAPVVRPARVPGRMRLGEVPAGGGLLALSGAALIETTEAIRVEQALRPGDTLTALLGGPRVVLTLYDPDQAQTAGKRGSGVAVTHPSAALIGSPDLSVRVEGRVLAAGIPDRTSYGTDSEWLLRAPVAPGAEHLVALAARVPLATVTLPFAIALDLDALPGDPRPTAPAVTALAPTRVVIPAGEHRLDAALVALRASGNPVLVDLGVDGAARATLPALDTTFWEAALAVATAFGLEPLPPAEEPAADPTTQRRIVHRHRSGVREPGLIVGGGPLRLGRARSGAVAGRRACGPLLVEAVDVDLTTSRGLEGAARQARLRLRVRVEPRMPRDLISEAALTLASMARGPAGQSWPVGSGADENDAGDGQPVALFPLTVGELPPGAAEVELKGQLQLRLRRTLRAEVALAAGASTALTLGGTALTLSATAGEGELPGRVVVAYFSGGIEDLVLTVRSSDGTTLGRGNKSSSGINRRQEDTWQMTGLVAGQAYTVVVTAYEPLAQPALPVGVAVGLP